uniref:Uncharacterized protein n=1 Tax=Ciona savignyi TaxID=51511 RepID=H2Z748_CIOSA
MDNMATISSEFSGIPSSNASNSFDLYSNLTNGGEMHDQHQQRILRPQKMMQHMRFPQCPDPNIPTTSPTPTQQFHHDNVSPTPNQVTPEKPSLSQSPPSPADSGVVADAKSDSIISQDLLHSFEQSENLDFMVNHKSPIPGMSFTASTISNEEKAQNSEAIFQPSDLNSLGLAPSAGFMSGLGNLDETESPAVPQSLAAIWAAPPPTSTVDDVLLQSFQQQQQLSSWPGQLSNGVSPNPPPGLYNTSLQNKLQQQNTAAQIQAIQQQLVMRRSQSTFMPQPGQLNRSTSHQPGAYLGMGGAGGKMNKPYSSWSNGQMLQGTWP